MQLSNKVTSYPNSVRGVWCHQQQNKAEEGMQFGILNTDMTLHLHKCEKLVPILTTGIGAFGKII